MYHEWDGRDALSEAPRWNSWTRVQPVWIEGEERAVPREVRLCCAAARVGDPVQIIEGERTVAGRILAVTHSVLHVRRE